MDSSANCRQSPFGCCERQNFQNEPFANRLSEANPKEGQSGANLYKPRSYAAFCARLFGFAKRLFRFLAGWQTCAWRKSAASSDEPTFV